MFVPLGKKLGDSHKKLILSCIPDDHIGVCK
jgi:hypothetical protein